MNFETHKCWFVLRRANGRGYFIPIPNIQALALRAIGATLFYGTLLDAWNAERQI